MIEYIKKMFSKLFHRKIKLLEESKQTEIVEDENDFKINLRQKAFPKQNDGNGYGICKIKLEDMI